MLFKTSILAVISFLGLCQATPHKAIVARQAACPAGPVTVVVQRVISTYPVIIDQFFQQNTVLNVNDVNIAINNAPVQFSTSFLATTTSDVTSTVTATETALPSVTITRRARKRSQEEVNSGPKGF